jgi:hypothetical protein
MPNHRFFASPNAIALCIPLDQMKFTVKLMRQDHGIRKVELHFGNGQREKAVAAVPRIYNVRVMSL